MSKGGDLSQLHAEGCREMSAFYFTCLENAKVE